MKTIKGARCVRTGNNGSAITKFVGQTEYVQVQMLPAAPQRIQWVAKKNLQQEK